MLYILKNKAFSHAEKMFAQETLTVKKGITREYYANIQHINPALNVESHIMY